VILGGIARHETVDGFSPTLVITDEPGNFAANEIETQHIRPRSAAHDQAPAEEEPEEEEAAAPRP
jgi:hypothetical protein